MDVRQYTVKATKQAQIQMREIALYIVTEYQNPAAALHLLDAFDNMMASLQEHPHRISLTQEEPWRSRGVHKAIVENFLMYFWVNEDTSTVQVIAVVYSGRDQRKALAGAKQ